MRFNRLIFFAMSGGSVIQLARVECPIRVTESGTKLPKSRYGILFPDHLGQIRTKGEAGF